MPEIVFLPDHVSVKVSAGTSIQEAGRSAGLLLDAPCGGHGLCGKCKVRVGKQEVLACQYQVDLTRQQCDEYLKEWEENNGIEVHYTTEDEVAQFKALSDSIYEEAISQYGFTQELIDLFTK